MGFYQCIVLLWLFSLGELHAWSRYHFTDTVEPQQKVIKDGQTIQQHGYVPYGPQTGTVYPGPYWANPGWPHFHPGHPYGYTYPHGHFGPHSHGYTPYGKTYYNHFPKTQVVTSTVFGPQSPYYPVWPTKQVDQSSASVGNPAFMPRAAPEMGTYLSQL